MLPLVISSLLNTASARTALVALSDIIERYLADKKIQLESKDKDGLAAEILLNGELIRGNESPEEASRTTREVVEQQVKVLENEINRLTPIATREHWVALIFAIAAGIVFILSIVLAIIGTVTQAIITLLASAAPGFLSKVFFSREAKIEERLREISADLRESEKARERLTLLEQALEVVPEESRNGVVEEYTKKMFKV